ncbi:MAG: hypothetical protein IPM82_24170 [Saprospiraceae bacterium]|nr:hypothetical protein [Saprospiraceae bacterium]
MGNTSNVPEIFLGEISSQNNAETAVLEIHSHQPGSIQVIVQDKLGKSVLTSNLSVEEGSEALAFDTKELKNGIHHAWIYINDKVFVRQFTLEGKAEPGLMGKFFSMFK